MDKGDLVRIRHNERHGLFILMESVPYDGSKFVRLYSLKQNKICFDMVRSLEVIDASR